MLDNLPENLRRQVELPQNDDILAELKIDKPLPHGKRSTYTKYGCRGPLCRDAEKEYGRSHRKLAEEWRDFTPRYARRRDAEPDRIELVAKLRTWLAEQWEKKLEEEKKARHKARIEEKRQKLLARLEKLNELEQVS